MNKLYYSVVYAPGYRLEGMQRLFGRVSREAWAKILATKCDPPAYIFEGKEAAYSLAHSLNRGYSFSFGDDGKPNLARGVWRVHIMMRSAAEEL